MDAIELAKTYRQGRWTHNEYRRFTNAVSRLDRAQYEQLAEALGVPSHTDREIWDGENWLVPSMYIDNPYVAIRLGRLRQLEAEAIARANARLPRVERPVRRCARCGAETAWAMSSAVGLVCPDCYDAASEGR